MTNSAAPGNAVVPSLADDDEQRIIIVDSQQGAMQALADGLESYGYIPVLCNPDQWAEHVRPHSAGVVVGPNLSPRETWRLCRAMRSSVQAPLFVLSAAYEPDHLSL